MIEIIRSTAVGLFEIMGMGFFLIIAFFAVLISFVFDQWRQAQKRLTQRKTLDTLMGRDPETRAERASSEESNV